MEQHDKVIYEQGYSDAIREFAERMIDYFVDIYGCSEEIAIREIAEQALADMKKG